MGVASTQVIKEVMQVDKLRYLGKKKKQGVQRNPLGKQNHLHKDIREASIKNLERKKKSEKEVGKEGRKFCGEG